MPRKQQSRKTNRNSTPQGEQMLRIIAGEWRGRKIPFPAIEGLRPTPDRVRETLFNWLQATVPGARVADLFAGSGALGLEALSRGAQQVAFVDLSAAVTRQLQQNLQQLKASNAAVNNQSAEQWLAQQTPDKPYDLVFLDPPFNKGMVEPICQQLEQLNLLAEDALIYIEVEKGLSLKLPDNWQPLRQKQAGQVSYQLLQRSTLNISS